MKRTLRVVAFAVSAITLFGGMSASAVYLLQDRFGVTPTLDLVDRLQDTRQGNAWSYHFMAGSLVPTKNVATANVQIDDWWGSWSKTSLSDHSSWSYTGQVYPNPSGDEPLYPSGDEPYDVEALYFDNDADNMYIAVITSFPAPEGMREARASNVLIPSGDLAIDIGERGTNSLTSVPDSFRYDYGVNVNNEKRPLNANDNVVTNWTIAQQSRDGFYATGNSDWYTGTPANDVDGHGERTNFDPAFGTFGGALKGAIDTTYRKLYFYDDGTTSYAKDDGKTEIKEGLWDTYVIEATIPFAYFTPKTPFQSGDVVRLSWVEGCRNDTNEGIGIIRLTATIPEAGTMSALLLSFGGGLFLRRLLRRGRAADGSASA